MLGSLLALSAAFCWGTSSVFARLGLQQIKPAVGTLLSIASSLVLVSLLFLFIEFNGLLSFSPAALLWFSVIGFVNYVLGRQFNYLGIKRIGVSRATPIVAASPLFSMLLAVIFTGETVSAPVIIGSLSIMAGLFLLITEK